MDSAECAHIALEMSKFEKFHSILRTCTHDCSNNKTSSFHTIYTAVSNNHAAHEEIKVTCSLFPIVGMEVIFGVKLVIVIIVQA